MADSDAQREAQRRENCKALRQLHPGNRLRLMFGQPLLPDPATECEERVIAAIRRRRDMGRQKYAATMDRTDLTVLDWLQHAQEEAMDLAIYLERVKGEVAALAPLARRLSTAVAQMDTHQKAREQGQLLVDCHAALIKAIGFP